MERGVLVRGVCLAWCCLVAGARGEAPLAGTWPSWRGPAGDGGQEGPVEVDGLAPGLVVVPIPGQVVAELGQDEDVGLLLRGLIDHPEAGLQVGGAVGADLKLGGGIAMRHGIEVYRLAEAGDNDHHAKQ